MRRQVKFTLVVTCAIWPMVGCVMTPPIKTAGYGAPGNAEPDEVAVGIGHDAWIRAADGGSVDVGLLGASVSIPVAHKERDKGTSSLRIEAGGDGNIDGVGMSWADAWGGVRYGIAPRHDQRPGFAWDLELGGGGGSFFGLGYGGGFAGAGLGYWVHPAVAPFGRARAQITTGGATPATFWWDVRGGIGLAAPRGISGHVLVGGGGWVSPGETASDQWLSLEIGLTVRIPTPSKS